MLLTKGWIVVPKFSQQKEKQKFSLSQWDQKTVTSDPDQLQSTKPAEMSNNDQERCHRKMGWLLERMGNLKKNYFCGQKFHNTS